MSDILAAAKQTLTLLDALRIESNIGAWLMEPEKAVFEQTTEQLRTAIEDYEKWNAMIAKDLGPKPLRWYPGRGR